jgi:hypothetical protein
METCHWSISEAPSIMKNSLPKRQSSILEQLRNTSALSSEALEVRSPTVFFLAIALTATCLGTFQAICKSIIDDAVRFGFVGDESRLQILDLRFGYSPRTVSTLLSSWGHSGRMKYLVIEAIDTLFYCPGYRAAFVVLLNFILGRFVENYPSFVSLRWSALLPVVLANIDFWEDAGQITLTVLYDRLGPQISDTLQWRVLVNLSSIVNRIKWLTVRTGMTAVLVIVVLTLLSEAARFLSNAPRKKIDFKVE